MEGYIYMAYIVDGIAITMGSNIIQYKEVLNSVVH